MNSNLLATKYHQPTPLAKRVLRPRLNQRLDEGLAAGCSLILVSAPAGFGKSTCVSAWASHLDVPVTWLSLDPSDDDPGRFLRYVIAALQRIDDGLGREIEGVLEAGQLPALDTAMTILVNDMLRFAERFVLVLDDFQVIQDSSVLAMVERLVANQPPNLSLVLVTREDPPLPLARLRANNQLVEIRAGDLRFSKGETEDFFNTLMGLELTEKDITGLETRTEGWIVGLQLAGLSIRGRQDPSTYIANLTGSQRFILKYLIEEVLERQSEELQEFLLKTSILDKLSGDLCDAVTARKDGGALLEHLFTANLFLIPLDEEQMWYRYHHLFADLLRSQQRRVHAEWTQELHLRASRWYEQAGMTNEAVDHALAGGHFKRAVELLETHATEMTMLGYAKTIEGWMQAIPEELHSQSPRANLAFAWMYLLRGIYARVVEYLQRAEMAIRRADADGEDTHLLWAEWNALQANLLQLQGKVAESTVLANQALQAARQEDVYIRGLAYLGLGGALRVAGEYAPSVEAYQQAIQNSRVARNIVAEMLAVSSLTLMAYQHGELHFASEVGSQAIERIERLGILAPPITGAVYGALGLIDYEWNRVEQARNRYARALQLGKLGGHNASVIYTQIGLSRLYLAQGDVNQAEEIIREVSDLLQYGIPVWLKPEIAAQQVRIALARANPNAAEAVIRQSSEASSGPDPAVQIASLRVALFRARESQARDLNDTLALANRVIETSQAKGQNEIVLQALLLRAQCHAVRGSISDALDDTTVALELGRAEGYLRTFIDEGVPVAWLIRRCLAPSERGWAPSERGWAQDLLEALPPQDEDGGSFPGNAQSAKAWTGLVEPLSERELEVLRLVAMGLKYEEIAGRLVISVNTVRFHIKAIYSKLNVNNRTGALALARELKLL
jgi:LuxR family transcriptional regulator, maltose regulon positive regulatory protein